MKIVRKNKFGLYPEVRLAPVCSFLEKKIFIIKDNMTHKHHTKNNKKYTGVLGVKQSHALSLMLTLAF